RPFPPSADRGGVARATEKERFMVHLLGSRKGTTCDGATRRDFLKAGGLGLGGLTLPDLLRARAAAARGGQPTKKTTVVWLWLGGGPTQIEPFAPKMTAPAEFRSIVGAVKTNVPGVEYGGVFPKIARHADKLAVLRSFAHGNSGHGGGTHWVMTGYDFPPADLGQAPVKPGLGAIVARHRGANNATTGLPTYVSLPGIYRDGPAWLGPAYAPFVSAGEAGPTMDLKVALERLSDRRGLMKKFDTFNRQADRSGTVQGLDSFEVQAFDLMLSRAREVFDLNREEPRTRDRYGRGGLGEQLLLARRLCEAGLGFVTLPHRGGGTPGASAPGMKPLGPPVGHDAGGVVG